MTNKSISTISKNEYITLTNSNFKEIWEQTHKGKGLLLVLKANDSLAQLYMLHKLDFEGPYQLSLKERNPLNRLYTLRYPTKSESMIVTNPGFRRHVHDPNQTNIADYQFSVSYTNPIRLPIPEKGKTLYIPENNNPFKALTNILTKACQTLKKGNTPKKKDVPRLVHWVIGDERDNKETQPYIFQ